MTSKFYLEKLEKSMAVHLPFLILIIIIICLNSITSTMKLSRFILKKYRYLDELDQAEALNQAVQMISHQKQIKTTLPMACRFWNGLLQTMVSQKELCSAPETMEFIIDITIIKLNTSSYCNSFMHCLKIF